MFNIAAAQGPKRVDITDQSPRTPEIQRGETIVIGVNPKEVLPKAAKPNVVAKVRLSGLAENQLSRAALVIKLGEDDTLSAMSLSDANTIIAYSTDQQELLEMRLTKGVKYSDEKWKNLGQHADFDIETEDGTIVRIRFNSGNSTSRSFLVEVVDRNEKAKGMRAGHGLSDFKNIN